MTIDEIIKKVDGWANNRTRYDGQEPRWDEALVAEIRSLREAVRVLGEYAAEWQVANGASDLTGTIRGDYGDDDAWTLTEGVSAALRIDEADRSMMANPIAAAAVEAARKGGNDEQED